MAQVINLNRARRERHKGWWDAHGAKVDAIIHKNVASLDEFRIHELSATYHGSQVTAPAHSWDYIDFRSILLRFLLSSEIIEKIMIDLKNQRWFDAKWLSKDRLLDRCLSVWVLQEKTC